jgi:hypothetical protein
MLPATAAGMIGLLCQPGIESARRSERRPDSNFHAGFACHAGEGYDFMAALPAGWQPAPEWGDWPYLIGWRHDRDRAVMTYCEGDLSIEIADTVDAYLRLLRRTTEQIAANPEDSVNFLRLLDAAHAEPPTSPAALGEVAL